jgi:transcriptional regulator with XRE-family HTH domain
VLLDCDPSAIPVLTGRDPPAGVRRWEEAQQEAVRHSVESGAAATGYVLAQLRKKHGKTMQQVADAIGMTLSVYHRVEMASRIIQRDEMEAVAKFYGLSAERLIAMFARRTRENLQQLQDGTPPEQLLPRTPRSLLKEDGKWGRLGALERYAIRRSIRYVGEPRAGMLPVHGDVSTDRSGVRRFTIDRNKPSDQISASEIIPRAEAGFFVRNFSQRLGFLLRPGSLAHVDPKAPVAPGDLAFLIRRDGTADAALVTGDGVGSLKFRMYNPEEEIQIDDPEIVGFLRVDLLRFG